MRINFERRKSRVQGLAHIVKGRGFGAHRNRESQEFTQVTCQNLSHP